MRVRNREEATAYMKEYFVGLIQKKEEVINWLMTDADLLYSEKEANELWDGFQSEYDENNKEYFDTLKKEIQDLKNTT